MDPLEIGIIGGSGLYEMPGLKNIRETSIDTPFGDPSDRYVTGVLENRGVAFLARQGRNHSILPTELNFRANIFGFKKLGVRYLLSASAVGSLRKKHKPMDFVLPTQFIDRTQRRPCTFFGNGIVAHIGFADPVCASLAKTVEHSAKHLQFPIQRGGTYVCMEGPAFSTRAESHLYRSWGADLIGMTNLQEAKLAREAEICYLTIAMVTDYDCWHEEEQDVTVQMLIAYLQSNAKNAQRLIRQSIKELPLGLKCRCQNALENAIITAPDAIPKQTRQNLAPIVSKYLD